MKKPADKKLEKIAGKELYRLIKDGAVIDIGGNETIIASTAMQ